MTTTTPPTTNTDAPTAGQDALNYRGTGVADDREPDSQAGRRRASRLPVIVMMIVSLVLTGLTRKWAMSYQSSIGGQMLLAGEGGRAQTVLGGMGSFSLAMVLGGLRGPLVMYLWATSESQKANRNLEDVDTKIEWIRVLQPEFDTVIIFQIWNKAYNISAQMASLPAKYATILDAIRYANSVLADRPDDRKLNILEQLSQVWARKLGDSQESPYYRSRVRAETQWRPNAQTSNEPGTLPTRLPPMLDKSGMLLPQYTTATRARPADVPAEQPWYDGSEFQYLEQYQFAQPAGARGGGAEEEADLPAFARPYPFKFGLSAVAIGYNYAKRSQMVMDTFKQKPLQLSEMVIDSRPALELKGWSEDEVARGRQFELHAVGSRPIPESVLRSLQNLAVRKITPKVEAELLTLDLPPGNLPADDYAVDGALYSYGVGARVARDSRAEFERHFAHREYFNRFQTFESHVQLLKAQEAMCLGDRDFLLVRADPVNRLRWASLAAKHYRQAITEYEILILRHEVSEDIANKLYPSGYSRAKLDQMTPAQLDLTLVKVLRAHAAITDPAAVMGLDQNSDERAEYLAVWMRAVARQHDLNAVLGKDPRTGKDRPVTQPLIEPAVGPETTPSGAAPATQP